MSRIVWLSTRTMLLACGSVAEAVAKGKPGDHIIRHDPEANAPAGLPAYLIHATRTGRKVAIRLRY